MAVICASSLFSRPSVIGPPTLRLRSRFASEQPVVNGIYALPRNDENIFFAGADLAGALAWVFWGGTLYARPIEGMYFEAH